MTRGTGTVLIFSCLVALILAQNARPHYRYADNNTRGRRLRGIKTTPSGFSPSQVKTFYNLVTSATAGSGKTIGIVDAYACPNTESDLAVFATQYGLPACTTANGCFTMVNQNGGSTFVTAPSGQDWSGEISLDVQWAHAIAPGAKKILCLAASSGFTDMMACVTYLKTRVNYISMSFGGTESASLYSYYNSLFVQSGVSFFASTGDSGPEVEFPAGCPTVVAVGGTHLAVSGNTVTSETAWSSTGGGCSAYQARPSTQLTSVTGTSCSKRSVPDVSFLADPNTGVAVYNSYGTDCTVYDCWGVIGGTSLSAPCTAAIAATVGMTVDLTQVYSGTSITFRDITSGTSSGSGGSITAATGYDMATGRGSWINAASLASSTTAGPTTTTTTTTLAPGQTTTKGPTTTTTKGPTTTTTTHAPTTTPAPTNSTTTPAPTPYDPLKQILSLLGSGSSVSVNVFLVVAALAIALL